MFSESQLVSLAVGPKITSTFSILGSIFIVTKVLRSPQRRSRSHHRLLAGMSVCDFFASFATFLSTWPIPIGTRGVKFAAGNITSCAIQGFMANFNIAVALYNTALAIYYLLVVRYKFTTELMRKIELVMHLIPFCYAVLFGIALAIDTSLNPAGQYCWVSQVPFGCSGDNCLRGKRATLYQWVLFGIISSCLIVATFATVLLYWTVYQQDKAIEANLSKQEFLHRRRRKRKSRDVAKQATFYIAAFYLTWIFSIANRLYFIVHRRLVFGLFITASMIHPLQGAINVLVYMRRDLFSSDANNRGSFSRSFVSSSMIPSFFSKRPTSDIHIHKMKSSEEKGRLSVGSDGQVHTNDEIREQYPSVLSNDDFIDRKLNTDIIAIDIDFDDEDAESESKAKVPTEEESSDDSI